MLDHVPLQAGGRYFTTWTTTKVFTALFHQAGPISTPSHWPFLHRLRGERNHDVERLRVQYASNGYLLE